MKRPTGVTVIAVIMFLGAAYGLGMALGVATGIVDPKSISPEMEDFPLGEDVLANIAIFAFGLSATISLLLGLGLWFTKNWARITAIVFGSLAIPIYALSVLGSALMANDLDLVTGLLGLGYNVWVVWYLVQPPVKAAFAPAPAGPHDIPPPPPNPTQEPPTGAPPPAPPDAT